MKDIIWTIEPDTITCIDDCFYGMTTLGGHIVKIGQDKKMQIIWENTESRLSTGLYVHACLIGEKIAFIPFDGSDLILFKYKSNSVERITLRFRNKFDHIFPLCSENELRLINLSSMRVYKLKDDNTFIELTKGAKGKCVMPNWDCFEFEKSPFVYRQENEILVDIYDFYYDKWDEIKIESGTKALLCKGGKIWYVTGNSIKCKKLYENVNSCEVYRFDQTHDFFTMCSAGERYIYVFPEKSNRVFKISLIKQEVEVITIPALNEYKKSIAYHIDKKKILIWQFENRCWYMNPDDLFIIFDIETEKTEKIEDICMDARCRQLLKNEYCRYFWERGNDNLIHESNEAGIELLIDSILHDTN